ncbi:FlgO family outer membrane protein [Catenovulum adriaticum]|uniref:FlgO family outer membrane protein n=1 Tax=Catenovulum adriaticum TaxID=2984846 RepID=A0ABY7AIV0_9ALTE|nr:FlgO family outer membrane protein [Catenovulum sp. TS8]WAJ69434.1 FlgO family outer membrane protein [Catenovulum sp. TS8]
MKSFSLLAVATASVLTLAGCHSIAKWQQKNADTNQSAEKQAQLNDEIFNGHQDAEYTNYWARSPHAYLNKKTAHLRSDTQLDISDYVEAMSMRLIKNMRYVSDKTPIAVTSFVPIDSNLEQSNLLGMHLAESFQHNMQNLGLSVIDYKATGTIRVTDQGDFSLSRDIDELKHNHPIEYILTGTFTYKDTGIDIYARVIGVESRAIVASSQGVIPTAVAEQLISSKQNSGISLVNQ